MIRAIPVALLVLAGCSGPAPLPPAPKPLQRPDAAGPPTGSVALVGRFRVAAELTQTAETGPPLRLKVSGVVTRDADGAATLDDLTAVPSELIERVTGPDGWPFDVLEAVADEDAIAAWLRRIPGAAACEAPAPGPADVELTVGSGRGGRRVAWSATTVRSEGVDHVAELAGRVDLGVDGAATRGRVEAFKWTRYAGCRLVQQERVTIEALRPAAPR